MSTEKDAFNYFLSAQRQSVERVFGVMVNRFGILWRQMSFSFDRYKLVLVALCRLHNFISQDRELSQLRRRSELWHEDDTLWRRGLCADGSMPDEIECVAVSHARDCILQQGVRSDLHSDRRVRITQSMRAEGVKRPQGSRLAQELRYRREACNLTCGK